MKIQKSALAILGHECFTLSPTGNTRPSRLVQLPDADWPKEGLEDSNFILVQPPAFSCWTDMVLDHKTNDHLVEYSAH